MISSPLILHFPSSMQMTDDQFFQFCQENRDLRIERNQFGEISIMSPAGSETGNRNFNLAGQLYVWSEKDNTGICFDSSTGFTLSTGAKRSPDAAWIKLERWNQLTPKQQKKFAPICPDFVIELRSDSDNLQPLKEKMQEYMQEPGIQLGLLIDRKNRRVYIYRPGEKEEYLENPDTVNCDPVLPGFVLNMGKIW
ncbi:Uma2 family endonuclease [Dolichospermum circinale CS-534/05]|uniref:Uma2 family endonuclease n=5 Tax=Dolichospermum circinale TaxID=109265 RepID=UPI002330104F|nr:Uma2 family endonuclease [Dolichospermum circinale]MDB9462782.1 Uma2 family endonuclease [Dolichospermum circinale CS-541/04]MDB9489273.1 Uma2 family endonuclease [Dolichospermum circinale CS-534/05]MDB9548748.1 Uma2 family endonuclease [Dolichospermum circinale CS-1031]